MKCKKSAKETKDILALSSHVSSGGKVEQNRGCYLDKPSAKPQVCSRPMLISSQVASRRVKLTTRDGKTLVVRVPAETEKGDAGGAVASGTNAGKRNVHGGVI